MQNKTARQIRKIKYDGRKVLLQFAIPRGEDFDEYAFNCTEEPAESFKAALMNLRNSLAGLIEVPAAYTGDVEIRGVSLSYHEDPKNEDRRFYGVTITGIKPLSGNNSPFIINSPHYYEIDASDQDMNLLAIETIDAIDALLREAAAYIDGKRKQLSLFDAPKSEPQAVPA